MTDDVTFLKFDMQSTMPLPKLTTSVAFYLHQLWLYNVGIHITNSKENKAYFHIWSENEADRGCKNDMPHCECYDWAHTHWPCKHMLSIFRRTSYTWDDLCPLYHKSPFFCTDTELFNTEPSYIQSAGAPEALDVEFRPESYYFTNYVVWLSIYY